MSNLPGDLIYFERSNNKKQKNFDLGKVRARVDLAHPPTISLNSKIARLVAILIRFLGVAETMACFVQSRGFFVSGS